MTKEIVLSQGMVALVDDDDYEWLNSMKWHAHRDGHTCYARHAYWENGACKTVKMHRVIMGAPQGKEIDHMNGNGLDNRKSNLRICSTAENQHNGRKWQQTSSRYKGVSRWKNKWRARLKSAGKEIYLGTFDTEEEAAKAYDEGALRVFGPFAYVNDIQ